jgi:CDP-glucose 4,6-dehydratase
MAMISSNFWRGKKVFITGHTGFKGSWLCLWLTTLGAEVFGYALDPPTDPSLFSVMRLEELLAANNLADIRDGDQLVLAMQQAEPDVVIHLAAQPLVLQSYQQPAVTYGTNVMGTVNLLEAVRQCYSVKAVVNVTTDKCYENREWHWGYRENEPMGGYDPYSSSKACSELVTAAYRNSYFNPAAYANHGVAIASARAGNVIGGGDWAQDRLICDCVCALLVGKKILLRNPAAIRPWQHVLEPLSGYLLLAQKLWEGGSHFAEAWNFGPYDDDAQPVEWVVQRLCRKWGKGASYAVAEGRHPHEAHYLKLDCSKANALLGWRPRWKLEKALDSIIDWTLAYQAGEDMREVTLRQIMDFER